MTTVIFKRKMNFLTAFLLSGTVVALTFLPACKKNNPGNGHPPYYSSDVLDKWMTLQLRLMRNATGIANHAFSRHFAYTGIAALESLKPGLHPLYQWTDKWNGLTGLPVPDHHKNYYHPANVNAAMAYMNKALFPNANPADKAAIDSLENALNQEFLATQPASLVSKSAEFGKAVATAVFNWSETDNYKNANNPYTAPTGPGLWKPTPPAFANPATPYWGNNRPIIRGSTANTQPSGPLDYSTDDQSPFYKMVKKVYDVSKNLTDDQKAMAMFWRDVPGTTSPGHWLSILQQVIRTTKTPLYKSALAYAVAGSAMNDALISCFKAKYQYNLVRPVTYIREVMGDNTWAPLLTTPAHPEYVSAHASLSIATAGVLQNFFGNIGSFTDHTYDYLGFAPRTYPTLIAIGIEAGQSRLYAGIHYQPSIDAGTEQGFKVVDNIFKVGNSATR